jgi:hypothetical protein
MHATPETFAGFSSVLRVALFAGRRGGKIRTDSFFRARQTASPFPCDQSTTNNTSTDNMTSRPGVNESTEITSPRRTSARRGPRVSNACVNCRRRKVCGSGFPLTRRATSGVDNGFCRSSVRARSRGVNTAPRIRSTVSTRNLSSGKGLFCPLSRLVHLTAVMSRHVSDTAPLDRLTLGSSVWKRSFGS